MEATLVLYCCEDNHLHAALRVNGEVLDDQIAGPADDWPDYKAVCRDNLGRFAPCGGSNKPGGAGQTATQRREEQQRNLGAAKKLIDKIRDRGDKPTAKETQKLNNHLSGLTVTQLKALKADYGLKASGDKKTLQEKIVNRISKKEDKKANPAVAGKRPEPFKDGEQGQAWGDKAYAGWAVKLTGKEKDAIEAYTGNDYHQINKDAKSLRAGDKPDATTAETIKHLDSAIGKGRTDKDVITHRGVTNKDVINQIVNNVGGTFSDKAYQSTSVDKVQARYFSGQKMTVNIHVPKGSKGAYVGVLRMNNHEERELVLPRGSTYRIVSVTREPNGHYIVEARVEQG